MNTWHLDPAMATEYADGRLSPVLAASVEQHLLACADCRAQLRVPAARLDAVWTEVLERVQAPSSTLLERCVRTLGASPATARLVAATPALRGSWLSAVLVVLGLAIAAANASPRGSFIFMVLAPVLPLLGVAYSFGPRGDPSQAVVAATPYSMLRLLALRTALVVATTVAPATVASVFLPRGTFVAVAWLLPALALTMVSLAAARLVPVHTSALAMAGVWIALSVATVAANGSTVSPSEVQALQVVSLVVLVAGVWNLGAHRHDFSEQLRRTL